MRQISEHCKTRTLLIHEDVIYLQNFGLAGKTVTRGNFKFSNGKIDHASYRCIGPVQGSDCDIKFCLELIFKEDTGSTGRLNLSTLCKSQLTSFI